MAKVKWCNADNVHLSAATLFNDDDEDNIKDIAEHFPIAEKSLMQSLMQGLMQGLIRVSYT